MDVEFDERFSGDFLFWRRAGGPGFTRLRLLGGSFKDSLSVRAYIPCEKGFK